MDEFKVRSYTKKELALFYFPDASPHTAVNRLMRWINRNAPLQTGGAGRSGLLQDRQVVYVARGEAYRGASGGALRRENMEKMSSRRTLRMGTYKWVAGMS